MSKELLEEIDRLNQWIHDCQSGMYINCVYCGFRYGPKDEVAPTMQQALYDHIAVCPKHPLSKANARIEELEIALAGLAIAVSSLGIGLFGVDSGSTWKDAKASWWVELLEAYNRAQEVLNGQKDE